MQPIDIDFASQYEDEDDRILFGNADNMQLKLNRKPSTPDNVKQNNIKNRNLFEKETFLLS